MPQADNAPNTAKTIMQSAATACRWTSGRSAHVPAAKRTASGTLTYVARDTVTETQTHVNWNHSKDAEWQEIFIYTLNCILTHMEWTQLITPVTPAAHLVKVAVYRLSYIYITLHIMLAISG